MSRSFRYLKVMDRWVAERESWVLALLLELCYAQVDKRREDGRMVEVQRRIIFGSPGGAQRPAR